MRFPGGLTLPLGEAEGWNPPVGVGVHRGGTAGGHHTAGHTAYPAHPPPLHPPRPATTARAPTPKLSRTAPSRWWGSTREWSSTWPVPTAANSTSQTPPCFGQTDTRQSNRQQSRRVYGSRGWKRASRRIRRLYARRNGLMDDSMFHLAKQVATTPNMAAVGVRRHEQSGHDGQRERHRQTPGEECGGEAWAEPQPSPLPIRRCPPGDRTKLPTPSA